MSGASPGVEPRASLLELLSQIVDYAGLFPPAHLGMAETMANYAAYAAGEDAWMLGRLIVPATRLSEFEAHAEGLLPAGEDEEPWHLSAIVSDSDLEADLERILEFNRRHEPGGGPGLARIDVIEMVSARRDAIERALDAIPDELFPFFELPVGGDCRGLIAALVGSDAGAKVRTGGATADLYPAPARLAGFIAGCAGAGVPFKATAGLHHPLAHRASLVGSTEPTIEYGFLNVFVAAILAQQSDLSESGLVEVLRDGDAGSFTFDEDTLAWRGREIALERVADSRERFAISFGSCSFDEPRQDLRALGLL